MARAKVTTDHDEIRKWAEARGGHPAAVRSTPSKDATEAREHGESHASHHHGKR